MSSSPEATVYPDGAKRRFPPLLKYGVRLFMAWAGFQVWWYSQVLVAGGRANTAFSFQATWLLCALAAGLALSIWCVVFDTQIGAPLRLGASSRRAKIWGFASITFIYMAANVYCYITGQPEEPFMRALFVGWTPAQSLCFIVLVIVAGPISEELLFRHVLVNAIPWEKSRLCAVVITLAAAYLFQSVHTQYIFPSTYVALFAIAVVLTVARFSSKGLLLPYLLHAYCGVLALVVQLLSGDPGA